MNSCLSSCSLESVGAIIDRPPNNLHANYWNFRRKSNIIVFGDVILFHKITGRSMTAPTISIER